MLRSNETNIVMGVLNNNQTINIQNNMNNLNNDVAPMGCAAQQAASAFDALPKAFVQSMKTLFDILDDQQTGYVKFIDIEKGWQDDGSKGLPRGVMESLRKVTPTSGLLTFERFCAGLKLCLLRNQSQAQGQNENILIKQMGNNGNSNNNGSANSGGWKNKSHVKTARPPSAPVLDIQNPLPTNRWSANVRPHNISTSHRALSLPQLSPDSEVELATPSNALRTTYNSPPPPPKPPRASALNANTANAGVLSASNKAEIRNALQNWQMGVMRNELDLKEKQNPNNFLQQCGYRGSADGGSSSATDSGNITNMPLKKTTTKRREPRRHTLQNGIDYNMLKRLKQYEEEREVLLLGLNSVDKTREWYMQQIVTVQEKIKYLGRMGSSNVEQWSEVQQERLNFQRARVLEVNRSLSALAECWERGGFPFHFNLAIRTPTKPSINRTNVNATTTMSDRLRQQNRLLASEGHLKSERIAMLEREKQTLLAELFELKQRSGLARHTNSYLNVLSQSSPGCSSSSGGLGDADVVY
ncbi:suppressor APC domain-containing protein 2 [Calliphora vicina]|uniref:suppressor APC domain-containing protein 2 n=1 Tax=Calliphora vicina TaxID=7373 RepID=UPI00325ADC5B